jgi:hypothetical protein
LRALTPGDIHVMFNRMPGHNVLKDGEQAKGVVNGVRDHPTGSHTLYSDIRVQVKFAGGEQVEFEAEKLNMHKVGRFKVGEKVPVRYSAADHSTVLLDIPALEQKHAAERAEAERHFQQY